MSDKKCLYCGNEIEGDTDYCTTECWLKHKDI